MLMALSLRIVTLIGVLFSVHTLTSCNSREVEQQEKQTLELPPIENQLTGEQIDSLNEARREALIQKHNAISIETSGFKSSYQYQDFLDTSALFVLDGHVNDIVRQDGQMILIVGGIYSPVNIAELLVRVSIPFDLYNSRYNDFQDASWLVEGCFIVSVKNTSSTIIRHAYAEVTDYKITESGALDYANTRIYHHDEPTLFVYGELVDFYLEKEE